MSELIANGQVGFREFEDKLKTVCRLASGVDLLLTFKP